MSPFPFADPAAQAVGIDVGGTKIAGYRISGAGEILAHAEVPSPADDADALVAAIVGIARGLARDEVRCVGVGAAGMVDHAGTIRFSPNLAWRETELRSRIADAVALPTHVDNDGNVAAWGEFRVGAGRDIDHMLLVALGTGIGGGIVIDGRLIRGAHGFAGEVGHVIVDPDGPLCGCGNHGCWEQMASGTAIQRAGRRAAREHPRSLLAGLGAGDPEAITGHDVTRAAREGDGIARSVLAKVGRHLGEGLAGLVNILDPQLIVIGGGAVESGDLLLAPARAAFRDTVEAPQHRPRLPSIVPAALGNDAGGVGAGLLALEELAS
ncbi:MAG: ROK family protein [Actinomycetota bacterium]